ncbi:MAG: bifunctional phosphopantothenoylcysteine decarboxylase/phosphopantothenate--cysteine ligase CoaBC [Chitinophagales bacterium]|nr:bifunctional phosphopantothenoylcysteine decarboxylase/phosphopantothenate--cysteine ligase CoaBC [Chitinophagales bacterium]
MNTSVHDGSLQGKKILLGVCGGIAAYKCVYLVRSLIKEGAAVKVVMTPEAKDFVGSLTFSTVSKNPAITEFYNTQDGSWNNHVELAMWPDVMIIAPATANTLAKMATGICDNMLMATYFSAKCPVIICPAMDLDMWKHPSTQKDIAILLQYDHLMISPATGELASGLVGEGRMAEPEEILQHLIIHFQKKSNGPFSGKKVLITAGPTYEKIDPVRFIGNRSSGKMGFALAREFFEQGADVTIVHGPVQIDRSVFNYFKTIEVESAAEMYNACSEEINDTDIFVAAAAVADFTPDNPSGIKIKKENGAEGLTISLTPTKDILAEISKRKKPVQFMVGFALESNNAIENATKKLREKDLDLIVLNSLQDAGAGFQHDTNKITLLDKNNNCITFELKSKRDAARDIVNHIKTMTHA